MARIRKFIDIGANLTDLMYSGIYNGNKKHEPDLDSVLKRSWDYGLQKIIITGGNLEESKKALEIARSDDRLYSTVGCHPTRCLEFESDPSQYLEDLRNILREAGSKVVAIGECGLDFERLQFCPKDVQQKYFELQLTLSNEFKLPLFLHCRNAADDLYKIISNFPNIRGVVHSFDASLEEAQRFLDMGLYIGINGCSLKTNDNLQVVSGIPDEKILLETDCPWCEVRPSHAGHSKITKENIFKTVKKEKWAVDSMIKSRNEPCTIGQILDIIAGVKNKDADKLSKTFYDNTLALFGF